MTDGTLVTPSTINGTSIDTENRLNALKFDVYLKVPSGAVHDFGPRF